MDESQEHQHHRLIEEIAARVEERLVAKFAKWFVLNFLVIVSVIATAISAYYSLDARIREDRREDEMQDRRLLQASIADEVLRQEVVDRLRILDAKIDEINTFLRDHNSLMLKSSRK